MTRFWRRSGRVRRMADLAGLLGIAARAGWIVAGEEACTRALRAGRVHLILMATDTGANGEKKVTDKCEFYRVPLLRPMTKEELGRAIGKEVRTTVGITSRQFAKRLIQSLAKSDGGERV